MEPVCCTLLTGGINEQLGYKILNKCKWEEFQWRHANTELEMFVLHTYPPPSPPRYATQRSDNSHATPVPCQNRRAPGAPGGLATYTISVILWPGAIIGAHLSSRPRQLFNVSSPPPIPSPQTPCIKAWVCSRSHERCARRFLSEDNVRLTTI